MIVKGAIIFGAVLMLMPHDAGKQAAPVTGVFAAMRGAVLEDIVKVRADIAQSQRERGASLLDRI